MSPLDEIIHLVESIQLNILIKGKKKYKKEECTGIEENPKKYITPKAKSI